MGLFACYPSGIGRQVAETLAPDRMLDLPANGARMMRRKTLALMLLLLLSQLSSAAKAGHWFHRSRARWWGVRMARP